MPSETLSLDKILHKCHNKYSHKNIRQNTSKKKDRVSRKRRCSSSLDEPDNNSDRDSSEDSPKNISEQ